MRDSAPEWASGYVAVHLPEFGGWQGFHVMPEMRERGEALLVEARRSASVPLDGQAMPGIAGPDQAAVGALSATLAKLFTLAIADPPPAADRADAIRVATGAIAYALHAAAGAHWLLVTAWRDGADPRGFQTRVDVMDAGTLDEARENIVAEIERTRATWDPVKGFTELVGGQTKPRRG
jgi:hypothetical protein